MATSRDIPKQPTALQYFFWDGASSGVLPTWHTGIYGGLSNGLHTWLVGKSTVLMVDTAGSHPWITSANTVSKVPPKNYPYP